MRYSTVPRRYSSGMAENDFDAEQLIKSLTRKPGVYRMFDAQGKVLYVGKARNLKNRVSSYFRASGLATKTMAMVAKIHRVETTVTKSETEALLLEQNLIKTDRPPYNILLRDDKSYPFVHISTQNTYPRLSFHRGLKKRFRQVLWAVSIGGRGARRSECSAEAFSDTSVRRELL